MTYINKILIRGNDPDDNQIDLESNEVGNLITADFDLEIEKGNVVGHSHIVIAASNVDIDATSETIWKHTGIWVPMTVARTMSIVSDNANDTILGTGARTMRVFGIDENGEAQTEEIEMNGTTPVITTNLWLGINPSFLLSAGSSMVNQGTILFTSTTEGEVQCVMGEEDSITNALIYHVPIGSNFYLKLIRSSVFKSTGGGVDVMVDGFSVEGGVSYRVYQVDLTENVMPLDVLDLNSYSPIRGGSYIYFEGLASANNTTCRVAIEGILVQD
jgi:hypothetical protein